jgi:hypothetical protein
MAKGANSISVGWILCHRHVASHAQQRLRWAAATVAEGEAFMHHHRVWNALAAAMLAASIDSAAAWDDAKYRDLQGHWARFVVRGLPGQPSFDQTQP